MNALAEVAPGEIEKIVEGSSAKIIDYGKVPVNPSSPNRRNNVVLGVLAGVAVAILYITLRFLLDVRIKDEEDIYAMFELPVLASIPNFSPDRGKRRKKRGYSYGYAGNVQAYATSSEKGGTEK